MHNIACIYDCCDCFITTIEPQNTSFLNIKIYILYICMYIEAKRFTNILVFAWRTLAKNDVILRPTKKKVLYRQCLTKTPL